MGTEPRTATKRTREKVLFVDCRHYPSHTALQRSISYTGNAQRPLLCFAGLRYIDPPYGRGLVPSVVDRAEHLRYPLLEAFLRFAHRLAVTSRSRAAGDIAETVPNEFARDVMSQRCELKFPLSSSFRCYAF